MPSNLEIKTRVADPDAMRTLILQLPAVAEGILHQKDTYYIVPEGRLKLREIEGQHNELIYYERSEGQKERYSNYDVFRTSDPAALNFVLNRALGIRNVVEKYRELYMFGTTRIHLDRVVDLGHFMEFEIPVQFPGASEAQGVLKHLISTLFLDESQFIKGSYVDLLEKVLEQPESA